MEKRISKLKSAQNNVKSTRSASSNKGLAMVYTRAAAGVHAEKVIVEVHLANGLPAFNTVGLPETAVRESKDRVRGAILNSGFEFPAKRITVNLAPADLPKAGARFDLPIAIGILIASGQLPNVDCSEYELLGELALDGHVRKVSAVFPSVLACTNEGKKMILPHANAEEASLLKAAQSWSASHLLDVCEHLLGTNSLKSVAYQCHKAETQNQYDMSEVYGQPQAKRAMEIAAAGGHSMLMIGSPGTGKSMLAQRLPSIMGELDEEQALQVAAVYSVATGEFDTQYWRQRPFRAPHHSASSVALVGGGAHAKPGEISLAHHGVLFLDEFTEFSRSAIEQLREPLETGSIYIARANQSHRYPAQFQLIIACNPCPCGFYGDDSQQCQCGASSIQRYQAKLSGPILDRIDMHLHLSRVPIEVLNQHQYKNENSASIRQRVRTVQQVQQRRQGCLNSQLSTAQLEETCCLNKKNKAFLQMVCNKLNFSARSYHRLIKLARTIADIHNQQKINQQHLSEAIGLRALDRIRYK